MHWIFSTVELEYQTSGRNWLFRSSISRMVKRDAKLVFLGSVVQYHHLCMGRLTAEESLHIWPKMQDLGALADVDRVQFSMRLPTASDNDTAATPISRLAGVSERWNGFLALRHDISLNRSVLSHRMPPERMVYLQVCGYRVTAGSYRWRSADAATYGEGPCSTTCSL